MPCLGDMYLRVNNPLSSTPLDPLIEKVCDVVRLALTLLLFAIFVSTPLSSIISVFTLVSVINTSAGFYNGNGSVKIQTPRRYGYTHKLSNTMSRRGAVQANTKKSVSFKVDTHSNTRRGAHLYTRENARLQATTTTHGGVARKLNFATPIVEQARSSISIPRQICHYAVSIAKGDKNKAYVCALSIFYAKMVASLKEKEGSYLELCFIRLLTNDEIVFSPKLRSLTIQQKQAVTEIVQFFETYNDDEERHHIENITFASNDELHLFSKFILLRSETLATLEGKIRTKHCKTREISDENIHFNRFEHALEKYGELLISAVVRKESHDTLKAMKDNIITYINENDFGHLHEAGPFLKELLENVIKCVEDKTQPECNVVRVRYLHQDFVDDLQGFHIQFMKEYLAESSPGFKLLQECMKLIAPSN